MKCNLCLIFLVEIFFKPSTAKLEYLSPTRRNILTNLVNKLNTTWTATNTNDIGEVMSSDLTLPIATLQQLPIKTSGSTKTIPKNFDARKAWPLCESIRTVHNQASCGSCWAFATGSAMSDRYCIQADGKLNMIISMQTLVDCCDDCVPSSNGCNGGYMHRAWEYWVKHGLPSQECKPYTAGSRNNSLTYTCDKTCEKGYGKSWDEDLSFGSEIYRLPSVEEVQRDLMENGPLSMMFLVYEDFYVYKSGIYQHIVGETGSWHGCRVLGWGTENGVDYWLLANSWGPNFGEDGFFRIRRGVNECNIESAIDYWFWATKSNTTAPVKPLPPFVKNLLYILVPLGFVISLLTYGLSMF